MVRVFFIFMFLFFTSFGLETQILTKGKVLFKTDFSENLKIAKPRFWVKQNTRWKIYEGTLVGIAAPMEYQDEKRKIGKGHFGDIPRIGLERCRALM